MPDALPAPRRRRLSALLTVAEHVALAVVAFVPQLLAHPGVVVADTKSYLYLDTGRFLRQSASMWDPSVGLGTVTHQQIGYLFPMGPFFWVTHALGVPTWAAQRLWIGALLFVAGAGVHFLCRTLALPAPARTVAAFAYMLSPYFLQYVGRISVILLPWAALGWLIAFVERGLRRGDWRYPALFALTVAAMSSVNASGALYVGLAPALWLVYAGISRLHPWSRVGAVVWRSLALTAGTSLWWVAGLATEGAYGLDVLKYTETVPVVSSTSLSSEVLRGLGYWYFYGGDAAGPWVPTLTQFTQQLWLLAAGYGTAFLAVAGSLLTRWRYRSYFVVLLLAGMVLAVGAYPFFSPSAVGLVLRGIFTHTQVGLAMRSNDRATPLVLVAVAVLLAAAVTAVLRQWRLAGFVVAGIGLAVVVVANPAVWNGTTVPPHFTQPATAPAYVRQAATALNAVHPGTRVLAVPGENFAAYRYGDTVDPIWPALLTRPFVTREQQVVGSLPGIDLLYGFDDPMQNGVTDPNTIAPIARLLGAGDVLVQNDLAYERYNQPDPSVFWSLFTPTPPGLGPPQPFGTPRPNVAPSKAIDEQTLALSPAAPPPPPVAVLPVANPRPLVRTEPVGDELVVDGDGPGLVAAAGDGLLAHDPPVVYAGTLDGAPSARKAVLSSSPHLVVTDSNRNQAFRWNTISGVAGRTLGAGERQPIDPNDSPLDIFPAASADGQTTTALSGVASVTASSYGNSVAYLPETRPVEAIDGNLDTSWEIGPFANLAGQWWQVAMTSKRKVGAVTIVQDQNNDATQWITAVTLRFDGGRLVHAVLGPASRTPTGQVITFRPRKMRILRITIDATNLTAKQASAPGASPVGLAEVGVDDAKATEHVVVASDLLRRAGTASQADRLTVVLSRQRVAPVPPRRDPETALDRVVWLPTARTFTLTGTARINTLIPDAMVDTLVGRPGSSGSGVVAYSLGRLPGDLHDTASAALDGNPSTWWSPGLGAAHQAGQWLSVNVPRTITFDHLDLQVVADGQHSVPTSLEVATERGSVEVPLPAVADGPAPGSVVSVPVHFPALTGRHITVTVRTVRLEMTSDYYSGTRIALPLGIAELGIPGVRVPAAPTAIPAPCRSDLLSIDGQPVPVRISGTSAQALAGGPLSLTTCGADAAGIRLGPGDHDIVAAIGHHTGIDLDQLVLDSAPGGAAQSGDSPGALAADAAPATTPAVTVLSEHSTSLELRVSNLGATPFWLVLGESYNQGWHATVDGGPSLGTPTLVDGFANGWLLEPSVVGTHGTVLVSVTWAPQRDIDIALVVSAAAGALCLVLVAFPVWRRRRRARHVLLVSGPAGLDSELQPALEAPWSPVGVPPAWPAVVVGAAGAGAVAAAVADPWWGAVVVVAVGAACLVRWARAALALGSVVLLVVAVAVVVERQANGRFGANGFWPLHFDLAHTLVWGSLLLLGGDVVVNVVRRFRRD